MHVMYVRTVVSAVETTLSVVTLSSYTISVLHRNILIVPHISDGQY